MRSSAFDAPSHVEARSGGPSGRSGARGRTVRARRLPPVGDEFEKLAPKPYRFCGGKSLHAQSHGEEFLSVVVNRWDREGLYVLDEPEAALSPAWQLALLSVFHLHQGSQFVIATHSPILIAYPDTRTYRLSDAGIAPITCEETDHYRMTRDFLNHRERYLETPGRRGTGE